MAMSKSLPLGRFLLNNRLLCIDVGNTNITFGIYEEDVLTSTWRMETQSVSSFSTVHDNIINNNGDVCHGVMIGSVVPKVTEILQGLYTAMPEANILFCNDKDIKWGLEILSGDMREVGEDILLNGISGYEKYKKALLIIDFGTATTFDVFNDDGNFVGTVIAPGVNLSLKALYEAAAQLPIVSVEPTQKIVGTNTKDCMQSGIYWGYISMIEGLVDKIQKELEVELQVIATGGLAPLFEQQTPVIKIVEQSLTLDGLHILSKRNFLLNE